MGVSPVNQVLKTRLVRLGVVLAVVLAVGVGGYGFHKYRKRTMIRQAHAAGLTAYEAGKWTEAANQLGRYLAANPRDVDVLTKYADAQMQRRPQSKGSVQQAASALESILRIDRGQPAASEKLVRFYLAMRAPIDAERVARAWSEAHPQDMEAKRLLAAGLIPQQKFDEAVTALEDVIAADPGNADAASRLAFLRVTHQKEDVQEGRKLLDAAVQAKPDSPGARLARAQFLLAAGQYADARADVEALERMELTDPGVILNLADVLATMGFYDRAELQWNHAEKAFPSKPEVYVARGQILLQTRDTEAGAKLADRAMAAPLGEQRLDVLPLVAELYAAAQQPQKANQCIAQLQDIDTPSHVLLYLQGLVSLAEGRTRDGINTLQESIKRAPKIARAHLALGRAQASGGNLQEAAQSYEEAMRLPGGSTPYTQVELARIYASLGRWADAAQAARSAERQAPLNARILLTSLEMQALAARPGGDQPDPTLINDLYARVQRFASRAPDELRIQILLARLAAWRGQLDEAAGILATFESDPDKKVAARTALSQIYADAGQFDDAIKQCHTAIEAAEPDRKPGLQVQLADLYAAAGRQDEMAAIADSLAKQTQGNADSALLVHLAESLARTGQPDKARELLIKAAANNPQDLRSRVMLLSIGSNDEATVDRQELVDQIKDIEGDSGRNWRIWQARIWFEADDWQSHRDRIESLLTDSQSRFPNADEFTSLLAMLYDRTGQTDQAVTLYERACMARPNDLQLATRLLSAATKAGQYAKVDQALSRFPADEPTLQPYYIDQALRKGQTDRASQMLEARLKADPQDYRARLQLAGLKRATGDTAAASSLLEEAARVAPDAVDVLAARVELHVSLDEHDQALALCNEALAGKTTPEALVLRASTYEAMGNVDKALADWQQVAGIDDWAERACLAKGQVHARRGEVKQAIEIWREGLLQNPDSYVIGRALSAALLSGDDQQQNEGVALLEKLLQDRPDDMNLLMIKAELKDRTDPEQAKAIYTKIAEAHPSAGRAFERLARMALDSGQSGRATDLVERGLIGSPNNASLLFLKAGLLADDSPGRAAAVARQVQTLARQALTAQPNNENAAVALARATAMVGDPDAAIKDLQAFVDQQQSGTHTDARLTLADLYMATRKFTEADNLIKQCRDAAPDDLRPLLARIEWHARQDQWQPIADLARQFRAENPDDRYLTMVAAQALLAIPEPAATEAAVELMAAAAEHDPDNPDLLGSLGLAYYQLGRAEDAKATFRRGLQAAPGDVGMTNNLAWIVCEADNDPKTAADLVKGVVDTDDGTSDFASLLDTSGVIFYRLAADGGSQDDLRKSREYLESCLAHQQVAASTRVAATFHLARTLTNLDQDRSRDLLQALLNDTDKKAMLSDQDITEATQLLKQLQARAHASAEVSP